MLPRLLDPRPYFANLRDPHRETRNKLHRGNCKIIKSAGIFRVQEVIEKL